MFGGEPKDETMTLIEPADQGGACNRSNLAHKAVSEMIRSRRLRGGELIVEAKLADVLGTSRTPLREALQRLEGEGLVVKSANRSFMVRNVDLGEYLQSLKVREILEGEAAYLATGHISKQALAAAHREIKELMAATCYHTEAHWRSDDHVHGLYIDACGNAVMGQMIRSLRVTTRLFEIARLADRVQNDALEHLEIAAALEAEDARAARKAAQAHIRSLSRFSLANVS
jgi:DNA-binding GntR family transcriptional regulator